MVVIAYSPGAKRRKKNNFTRFFQNCLGLKQMFYSVKTSVIIEQASELWQCKTTRLSLFKRKEITSYFSDRINTFSDLLPVLQPTCTVTKAMTVLVFPVCVMAEPLMRVAQKLVATAPVLHPLVLPCVYLNRLMS